jgi:lipopolysaccharide/colanic/teichoic acid biosynthesis glycosyltransferase
MYLNVIVRFLDITLSFLGLCLALPVLLILFAIGFFDTGSPLFFQKRMGRGKKPFVLVKFRTMRVGTCSVASHLADKNSITGFGRILRKSKLDELPQLWNVLMGSMSLVGPRPNLFTQTELITEREMAGVFSVRPGITGLAQVNNIDMSDPQLLAATDRKMIASFSLKAYFTYIGMTVLGKGAGDVVS